MDALEVGLERRGVLLGPQAVDPVQLVRPRHLAGLQVPLPGAEVRDALRLAEAGLAGPQLRLGAHARGDVPRRAHVAVRAERDDVALVHALDEAPPDLRAERQRLP